MNYRNKRIIKSSGDTDVFDEDKLIKSLERVGASSFVIDEILYELRKDVYDNYPSYKIYQKAYSILKKKQEGAAGKYKLKRAIMDLGPSGYPFEAFIGQLMKYQGYDVKVGEMIEGYCINHEVDIIADKDDDNYLVECKFHNNPSYKTDIKIPLYIYARFQDIERKFKNDPDYISKKHYGWIVTNTRFTEDAKKYAKCMGLTLIGWDYPDNGSLKQRIDHSHLHPVTCLSNLKKHEIKQIIGKNIVLCRQLYENMEFLIELGFNSKKINQIKKEIENVLD